LQNRDGPADAVLAGQLHVRHKPTVDEFAPQSAVRQRVAEAPKDCSRQTNGFGRRYETRRG
jgi:hypothetical protein